MGAAGVGELLWRLPSLGVRLGERGDDAELQDLARVAAADFLELWCRAGELLAQPVLQVVDESELLVRGGTGNRGGGAGFSCAHGQLLRYWVVVGQIPAAVRNGTATGAETDITVTGSTWS